MVMSVFLLRLVFWTLLNVVFVNTNRVPPNFVYILTDDQDLMLNGLTEDLEEASQPEETDSFQPTNDDQDHSLSQVSIDSPGSSTQTTSLVSVSQQKDASERPTKKRNSVGDPRIGEALNILKSAVVKDGCTVFDQHVGNKLRAYDQKTRDMVEYHINRVLYHADMGNSNLQISPVQHSGWTSSWTPEHSQTIIYATQPVSSPSAAQSRQIDVPAENSPQFLSASPVMSTHSQSNISTETQAEPAPVGNNLQQSTSVNSASYMY